MHFWPAWWNCAITVMQLLRTLLISRKPRMKGTPVVRSTSCSICSRLIVTWIWALKSGLVPEASTKSWILFCNVQYPIINFSKLAIHSTLPAADIIHVCYCGPCCSIIRRCSTRLLQAICIGRSHYHWGFGLSPRNLLSPQRKHACIS